MTDDPPSAPTGFLASPEPSTPGAIRLSWALPPGWDDGDQLRFELSVDSSETPGESRHVQITSGERHDVPWPFIGVLPSDGDRARVRLTRRDGSMSGWSEPMALQGVPVVLRRDRERR